MKTTIELSDPLIEQARRETQREGATCKRRRRSFLTIIVIAVTLEAGVLIFRTGTNKITEFFYPTGLLLSSGWRSESI
jgi:hypothetical protein